MHIYNVYSAGLGGLRIVNWELPIYYLLQLLNEPGEYIVVGDFNLHHPIWGGPQCLKQHNMADDLIRVTREAHL